MTVNPSTVNLEDAWNRREGKDRFGQPIQTPALAEDVKGDFNNLFLILLTFRLFILLYNKLKHAMQYFHGEKNLR